MCWTQCDEYDKVKRRIQRTVLFKSNAMHEVDPERSLKVFVGKFIPMYDA